jgi:hypothetical protein
MAFLRILLLFLIISASIYAKDYRPNWGNDPGLDGRTDLIALYKMDNWTVTGLNGSTTLPFFSDSRDTLIFTNSFSFSADSTIKEVYFKSLGFHGRVTVFLNGNQILKQPNASAPARIKINKQFLVTNSPNQLKIILIKNASVDNGFPRFTHLYTEPEYIGIVRPFYLELLRSQIFSDFTYQVSKVNKSFVLDYSYKISSRVLASYKNKSGLAFTESFLDSNNKVISRRRVPSPQKSGLIKNRIKISTKVFWTLDTRQFITFSVGVNRFGKSIEENKIKVAIRDVRVENNVISFNFTKPLIKGVTFYENLGFKDGSNLYAAMRNELILIKADGFNAIRFMGHIPDERFLSVADTLGLMLFIDLPLRRYPDIIFKKDALLENLKNTLATTITNFKKHPSFFALGVGQEIVLSDPATQKFYIILNGSTEPPVPFLTYLAPILTKNTPPEMLADFYMLDMYTPIRSKIDLISASKIPYLLAGKTGFNTLDTGNPKYSLQHKLILQNDIKAVRNDLKLQGGFLETFQDWRAAIPSYQNIARKDNLVKNGFYDSALTKYEWAAQGENFWDNAGTHILASEKQTKPSNVFSIILFFGSLIFFFFYKRYPRFSENYRRSIKHPYGFYVDMRERRIIPIFISFMLGFHNALILSIFAGSFIYFTNDSLLVHEVLNVLIPKAEIFSSYLEISKSELKIIPMLFLFFFFHPLLVGFLIKIIGVLTKNYIRLRQALAIGLWSGAPIIFMLPLSFAAYHLLVKDIFVLPMIIIFSFFILWAHIRLMNGIRVLILSKYRLIFLVLLLSYILPLVIFGFFFIPQPMWYDYLMTLLNSRTLF